MNKSSSSVACVVESLEPRLAPAGGLVLTTAGGVLTITGDTFDNQILISDNPVTGLWTISDNVGGVDTSFSLNGTPKGVGPFDIDAKALNLTTIKATLGDGNDQIEIAPSNAPSGLLLPGGINISTGKGNDTFFLGTFSAQTLVTGAVSVDLGEGDDVFDATLTAFYTGAVKIVGGLGNDTVNIDGVSADQVFQKGLTVDMGKGDNSFNATVIRLAVTGAFNLVDAGDLGATPLINFTSDLVTMDGPAAITIGAGNATVIMGEETTDLYQFGAGLKITAGAGNDIVTFEGRHTYGGAVIVDLKDGLNTTTIASNSSFAAASLTVNGGLGNDSLLLAGSSVTAINTALSINLGNGTNDFKADPMADLTSGSLSFLAGTGVETINYAGSVLRVLGAMTLNVGAGNSNVDLAPTTSAYVGGLLTLTAGVGTDDIDFNTPDFRIGGNLSVNLGAGSNNLTTAGTSLQIAGGVTFVGGAADDRFDVQNNSFITARNIQFTGGGVPVGFTDVLFLRPVTGSVGSVIYTGGAGSDALALGHNDTVTTTRFTVNGSVTGSMGAGTSQNYLTDTYVHGLVNVTAAGIAGTTDILSLTQSTFNGAVNVTLGAGTSSTAINDVFMRGAFTLNTGAGADNVELDTGVGTTVRSTWLGLVKINTGAGIDTFSIGSNPVVANAGNIFHRNVILDGGTEADTLVINGNNTFNAGSTLTQFNFP